MLQELPNEKLQDVNSETLVILGRKKYIRVPVSNIDRQTIANQFSICWFGSKINI